MYPFFDYYSISLLLGGIIAIISGLIVYLSDSKSNTNKAWIFLNANTAIWSFGYFLMINADNYFNALISNFILHAAAVLIPLAYLLFILNLTKTYKRYRSNFFVATFFALVFFILNPTKLFIDDVLPKNGFNYAPDAGPLYIYYAIYFFIVVVYSLVVLYKRISVESDENNKKLRLKYVLSSSLVGFIGGGSVFLLTFNINIPPYPIVLFAIYPIIITYAIIRHSLFNVKVIATELFTFSLWLIILFRTLLSSTVNEQIINGGLLVATVVLGIFLILGVEKEVRVREKMEKLAENLKRANARLLELDKQKSEFVSIASHQLRSPLTAIKGYASMLLEGSFSKVPAKNREPIRRIFESSKRLVGVVEDFLNITRIEQGRMKYDREILDINELVEKIVKELMPNIKLAGLTIKVNKAKGRSHNINADRSKMRQVILNLVDNAIKYTPSGRITITITSDVDARTVLIAVEDTGIGIPHKFMANMFGKFNRAENSKKIHANGSGIGLYLAHEIIEAHNGRIWAESDGNGNGSTFYVELPLVENGKKT